MRPLLSINVHAAWDADASVWVATSDDIDGLVIEAETMEALQPRVRAAIADLIELNGVDSPLADIPIYITSAQTSLIPNPRRA
jgi:hypothetical protein